jgi:acetyl esterase/lipase
VLSHERLTRVLDLLDTLRRDVLASLGKDRKEDGVRRTLVGLLLAVTVVAPLAVTASPAGATGKVLNVTEIPDVPYDVPGTTQQIMDIYEPDGAGPYPAVILVHGGGFTSGDKADVQTAASAIAQVGFVVFAPNYRLSPQSPFPAPLADVKAAVQYVQMRGSLFNADASRVGTMGFSAGGNLAEMVAYQVGGIKAVVSWSGPTDFNTLWAAGVAHKAMSAYLHCTSCTSANFTPASPTAFVTTGAPPSDLYSSKSDFVPISQQTELSSDLSSAGVHSRVTVEPAGHAQGYFNAAIGPSIAFLQQYLGT